MDGSARIEINGTVATGRNYRIRRFDVVPGANSGLRVHRHRTDQYVVLSGEARITLGRNVIHVGPDTSVMVPFGVPHRLENAGGGMLSVLEVQFGSRFEEDDLQGA